MNIFLGLLKKYLNKEVHVDYFDSSEKKKGFEEGVLVEVNIEENYIIIDAKISITKINGSDLKQIYFKKKKPQESSIFNSIIMI